MSADYILRLIQQISMILAGIISQRQRGQTTRALEEIEKSCLEHVGLPLIVIKQSTPEDLAALLETGGHLRVTRSLILAELLREEAIICEMNGNAPSASISYAHAERLLCDALPFLGPGEKEHFEGRLADISAKRRDLG
ncbi:MAG TPA: hypothetical protein VGA56_04000 [Opitutaceae bacterium]